MTTLAEQLECAFAGIGHEVGTLVRCMVQQELAVHLQRIEQLQSLLTNGTCTPTSSLTIDRENPTT
jgi:hypothetical protein